MKVNSKSKISCSKDSTYYVVSVPENLFQEYFQAIKYGNHMLTWERFPEVIQQKIWEHQRINGYLNSYSEIQYCNKYIIIGGITYIPSKSKNPAIRIYRKQENLNSEYYILESETLVNSRQLDALKVHAYSYKEKDRRELAGCYFIGGYKEYFEVLNSLETTRNSL